MDPVLVDLGAPIAVAEYFLARRDGVVVGVPTKVLAADNLAPVDLIRA